LSDLSIEIYKTSGLYIPEVLSLNLIPQKWYLDFSIGFFGHFGGMLFFSFFWAQDFCKKVDLDDEFFFRVSVSSFVTIYRKAFKNVSIMVFLFRNASSHTARVIVTKNVLMD
jgi:hypothetical protein